MGGDHHGPPYKVPDYSIYKIQDAPELIKVQNQLSAKGLKNPWLRNHVWRYNRKYFGTTTSSFLLFVFRGFPIGLGLALVAVGLEKGLGGAGGGDHGHDADHH